MTLASSRSFWLGRTLRLAPAGAVMALLFGGGLILAVGESVGLGGAGGSEFTLDNYREVLQNPDFYSSLALTTWVSAIVAVVSAAGGLAIALALRDWVSRQPLIASLIQGPLAIPHLVMALVVLHVLAPSGWLARLLYSFGLITAQSDFPTLLHDRWGFGIALVYILKEIPFMALLCLAVLARSGPTLEAVASTLGAGRWQRIRHVALPLAGPAVAGGSLIVFSFCFGAFEVPLLLGRPYPAMLGVVAYRAFASIDLADRAPAMAFALLTAFIAAAVAVIVIRAFRSSPEFRSWTS